MSQRSKAPSLNDPKVESGRPGGGCIERDRLVAYLDEYLRSGEGRDFGPNGLQVEGRREIRKVVTGVSACQELIDRAVATGGDALLVHHGLFWEGSSRVLTGFQALRVRTLFAHGINLLAYHLPLDRHEVLGNNVLAAHRLGLEALSPFAEYDGLPIGFAGSFPEPQAASELPRLCREVFGQEPLAFLSGPDPVRSVGIVSGGAQKSFHDAIAMGLDAYITGEVSEWVMNVARETGTHFLAAGHYATERLGIQALGEHVAQHLGLEVEFVDIPNPV